MEMKNYDVAVCGAGVAGCAAAIAAARSGMRTVLIEKQSLLGGLATSGLIYLYLPICDGKGNKVMGGIPEEMLKRSVEYSPYDMPTAWGGPENANTGRHKNASRYESCFSPAGFTLVLDEMLEEAGVDLWLDTMITGCEKEGNRVRSVYAINSSGTVKVDAECFIDATGGAYLAQYAGCKVHRTENNITSWFIDVGKKAEAYHMHDGLNMLFFSSGKQADCSGGKEVTEFIRSSWKAIRQYYKNLPAEEQKNNFPLQLPAMPQLRKIAAIDSLHNIEDSDCGVHFEDSIGVSGDWRATLGVWETPVGALIPRDAEGLIAAGRCIGSMGKEAWEVFRVIPAAVMTGEAAGTAAALCVASGTGTHNIDIKALQEKLANNDCMLFYPYFQK